MLTAIKSAKTNGLTAVPVTVECEITPGIGIHLVGLADAAVKESLLRTVTALQANGFRIPGKKIVINLAPADLHKSGTGYDLPIAVALIRASEQKSLPKADRFIIAGELGLDGTVRAVPGTYPAAELAASTPGIDGIILPVDCAIEAADVRGTAVYAVEDISEVLTILEGNTDAENLLVRNRAQYRTAIREHGNDSRPENDLADIPGNYAAKRALEIAAAGGHNILLVGGQDSDKERLAKALAGLLPRMTDEQCREVMRIYSVSGKGPMHAGDVRRRPFRAPHPSASMSALFGGGTGDYVLPGEVSLAHNGILFLNGMEDMPKTAKEAMRGVLEDKEVKISRLRSVTVYPARFQLVAAISPCPCGQYGEGEKCTCTPGQRTAFLERALPYAIMENIDIQAWARPYIPVPGTSVPPQNESTQVVAERVAKAIAIQEKRYQGTDIRRNAEVEGDNLNRYCTLDEHCKELMDKLIEHLGLSARSFKRMVRIARTIADLDNSDIILPQHLAEAASFRFLDRNNFAL